MMAKNLQKMTVERHSVKQIIKNTVIRCVMIRASSIYIQLYNDKFVEN